MLRQTMTCKCTRIDADEMRRSLGQFVRLILGVEMKPWQSEALSLIVEGFVK
jgi:hypothetical protein